jgi:NRPS condensation-like uncharacterized protein
MVSSAMRPLLQLFAAPRTRAYAAQADAAPIWRHIVISAGELSTLRARCGNATVNDILIAAMARVGARRSERRSVVVTYTMDLRRYSKEARLFATNSSAILAAIVPRDAIRDLAATTASVARLTARDRARLAGPAFMLAPYAFAAGAPHALARRIIEWAAPAIVDLPLDRGLLMTNVGRVDDGLSVFGDDIEAIRIVGPNVRGIPVPVVVALGFRGGLDLQLYAGPGFGASALAELEREIRDALELAAE